MMDLAKDISMQTEFKDPEAGICAVLRKGKEAGVTGAE